ncbi:MAG TPA: type II secretion system F family protein [Phycisphaerae bacterium]|jgi:tight adherence protein C|nr:type II secretion system F family protein [Phycisphaerae bacterium]HOB75033.1 type II secretion system F family protein [Phycisphaerae bacterium]HOJ54832.1 type II secretion system F family protein [Phycisphaerae bacterium]HOL26890.1 type II secretion system F family protein [Phycisphaerae bacterium]HPP20845.1 type II secretion system F family protein [Phycisphaerae bacterium]
MNEIFILGVLVCASVAMIIYSLWPTRRQEEEEVLRRIAGKRQNAEPAGAMGDPRSAARQVLEKVTPIAMKPVMPASEEEMSTLREKLAQAGFRRESATRYFLASKTILGAALAAVALIVCLSSGHETKHVLGMAAFLGGLGFMLPNLWLRLACSQRAEKIRNGLPDSLDLLVVSVESGLALDAGLQRVSDEMRNVHAELSEELQIATLETQMGVPRSEALENMARRTGVDEMRALVAVITQAEKFGTSVAKALRTQADALRIKRRLKAEERAQKTTVKLMLPLILFIFPSIFVVLLGPAAMRIAETLSKNGPLAK